MEVTAADFAILHAACTALEEGRVPYVVGGGTVVVIYGRQRRTKDFDIFINRKHQPRAMNVLSRAGFTSTDTEKSWLFKAFYGDTLVDLIVQSRGGVHVTAETIRRARIVNQFGFFFRVMSPEDLLYRKILTLTEGRPDWYDALSVIERQQGKLDWNYLLKLAQRHTRRVLGFLLFAVTELHHAPGRPRVSPDELYTGEYPGLIPEWVILRLLSMAQQQEMPKAKALRELPYWPKAA